MAGTGNESGMKISCRVGAAGGNGRKSVKSSSVSSSSSSMLPISSSPDA